MLAGFKQFILRGNVVDLAIGVVIGAAFGGVVSALVSDLINPLIGVIAQVPDLNGWMLHFHDSVFRVGHFINQVISFGIISASVYFLVVLPINALMARTFPAVPAVPMKTCPECLSSIPAAARRCAQCTAVLVVKE